MTSAALTLSWQGAVWSHRRHCRRAGACAERALHQWVISASTLGETDHPEQGAVRRPQAVVALSNGLIQVNVSTGTGRLLSLADVTSGLTTPLTTEVRPPALLCGRQRSLTLSTERDTCC